MRCGFAHCWVSATTVTAEQEEWSETNRGEEKPRERPAPPGVTPEREKQNERWKNANRQHCDEARSGCSEGDIVARIVGKPAKEK
jgi:hypothetical protein